MAEPLIARLGELAVKAETTKGTKNLPAVDGTESLFRIFDPQWTAEPRFFDRKTASKTLSRYPHLVGQNVAQFSFSIELRKNATTNNSDPWHDLLKACGFAFASGVWTLTTDSSAHSTLTLVVWAGSNGATSWRRGLRGCAGSCKLRGKVGEPMMADFVFMGSYDAADSDLLSQMDPLNTITHSTAIPGIFNAVSSMTWGSNADIKFSSFEVDFGQTVSERQDAVATNGISHFAVTDRDVTITLDPEVPLTSAENWYSKMSLGTEVSLALTHTQAATASPSVAAATFAFSFPKCQITGLTEGDRNGIKTFGVTAKASLSAEPGDDEFSLTVTKSS